MELLEPAGGQSAHNTCILSRPTATPLHFTLAAWILRPNTDLTHHVGIIGNSPRSSSMSRVWRNNWEFLEEIFDVEGTDKRCWFFSWPGESRQKSIRILASAVIGGSQHIVPTIRTQTRICQCHWAQSRCSRRLGAAGVCQETGLR